MNDNMITFRPEKNVKVEDTYPKGYFNLFGSCKNLDLVEIDDIDLWGTSSTTLAEKSEVHRTYAISKKVYKNENNFYGEISQGKEQPYSAIIRFIGGGDDKK